MPAEPGGLQDCGAVESIASDGWVGAVVDAQRIASEESLEAKSDMLAQTMTALVCTLLVSDGARSGNRFGEVLQLQSYTSSSPILAPKHRDGSLALSCHVDI